jgi:two-component system, chemotaxis family, response regulator Rcp1
MNNGTLIRPIDILLIEDNLGDIDLAREALGTGKLHNSLHVVQDGVAAMDFLNRKGKYVDSPRPDLIILDLNLPKKDGRQVLAEIKEDDSLKRIPVVILTTSRAEEDVLKTYNLHANCYITKPIDMKQFLHVVRSIEEFWLSIVVLPNGVKK